MRLPAVLGLALLALAATPTAAAANPACDVLRGGNGAAYGALMAADGLGENGIGPMHGGTYPGRSAVQGLVALFLSDGLVGERVHETCAPLDDAFYDAWYAAMDTIRCAEMATETFIPGVVGFVECTGDAVHAPAWGHL